MKQNIYEEICNKLNKFEDIKKLNNEMKIPEDLLHVIYTQKVTRNATKKYYKIKNKSRELVDTWIKGKTIYKISSSLNFPPVLMSQIILQEYGLTRKETRAFINDPQNINDERLKKELINVCKKDFAYSPKAHEKQLKRGKNAEEKIKKWLENKNIEFQREFELRKKFKKTPDFLLAEPMKIDSSKIYWIESKASFGDEREINKDMKKQLSAYKEMFGNGMVVYWFGFLEELPCNGVIVKSGEFFQD